MDTDFNSCWPPAPANVLVTSQATNHHRGWRSAKGRLGELRCLRGQGVASLTSFPARTTAVWSLRISTAQLGRVRTPLSRSPLVCGILSMPRATLREIPLHQEARFTVLGTWLWVNSACTQSHRREQFHPALFGESLNL